MPRPTSATVFEAQALVTWGDVDDHVPELPPARSEIQRQEQRAGEQSDEAGVEAEPGGRLIARVAHQAQEGRQRVAPAGEAGEEEVAEDVPLPLWRSHEVLGRRCKVHQGVPRRLNATMPPTIAMAAVTRAPT